MRIRNTGNKRSYGQTRGTNSRSRISIATNDKTRFIFLNRFIYLSCREIITSGLYPKEMAPIAGMPTAKVLAWITSLYL